MINFEKEIGAIWENTTKDNKTKMNIRLKIPKAKLLEFIGNNATEEEIAINMVAFPNKNRKDNPRTPAFRIFEEVKNDEAKTGTFKKAVPTFGVAKPE